MSANILDTIVQERKKDIAKLGFSLGYSIPEKRTRAAPLPFIAEKGTILEIKRASPSKGDIAPSLNAAETARAYAKAGTSAISVLTESHWFKGNLEDLCAVTQAVDDYAAATGSPRVAVLRKDFLIAPEEIDIAWRCGADAVLLIARILTCDQLLSMVKTCEERGMTAFIELRLQEDLDKLAAVAKALPQASMVCGVNARDLSNFSIDMLLPAALLSKIQAILGENARVVFESGIRTPEAAAFASSLGFTGMLLGEAAARKPEEASSLVSAFLGAKNSSNARAWLFYGQSLEGRTKPLIKICGLTNEADALAAAEAGADFLGFVFSAKSRRCACEETVRQVRKSLPQAPEKRPKLVGVITETDSPEGLTVIRLVQEGLLDFVQVHGEACIKQFFSTPGLDALPHYCAVNLGDEEDIAFFDFLRARGQCRILLDSKSGQAAGGTGKEISAALLEKVRTKTKLWLAGGIRPGNVREIVAAYQPELIDIASGVEKAPGIKDHEAVAAVCRALRPERH